MIFVGSYGHHVWGDKATSDDPSLIASFTDHPLYAPGMSTDDFMLKYTKHRRKREILAFNELVPHLKVAKGRLRLMTVVAKQDLWWPERRRVHEFYRAELDPMLDQVAKHCGTGAFRHELISASMALRNFTSPAGEQLKLTTSGYDQPLRLTNLKYFLEQLTSLLQEE